MAPNIKGSAAYKKKDGTVTISKDQTSLVWLPHGARDNEKAVIVTVAYITSMLNFTSSSKTTADSRYRFTTDSGIRGEGDAQDI
jgi:hypothetical protein